MSEYIDTSDYSESDHHFTIYLGELGDAAHHYQDLLMAAETYLTKEFYLEPYSLDHQEMITQGLFPDPDLFESSPRQALEQCHLIPFRIVLPYLEARYSETEPDLVERWLNKAVPWTLSALEDEHTPSRCLVKTEKSNPNGCDHSVQCPVKAIRDICLNPARSNSEDNQVLKGVDPVLLKSIKFSRIQVATEYDLVREVEIATHARVDGSE